MSEVIGLLYALLFLLVGVVGASIITLVGAVLIFAITRIIEKIERKEK